MEENEINASKCLSHFKKHVRQTGIERYNEKVKLKYLNACNINRKIQMLNFNKMHKRQN